MELMGVSSLPVAVGMYLGLSTATPIFFGGLMRWVTDKLRGVSASEAETETSPGVLLASGFIAGGTLCGLIIAFLNFLPDVVLRTLNLSRFLGEAWTSETAVGPKLAALLTFAVLAVILLCVGTFVSNESTESKKPLTS
jgi:hypothetical protein